MTKMSTLHKCLLLCIIIANSCFGSQRNLKSKLNPGCSDVCQGINVTVFHLRADGPNDTLHYVWDFIDKPSLLLAVTSTSAELNIDWRRYISHQPRSMNFTEKPLYTFGLSIEKILEFNDINDTGSIAKVSSANLNILKPQNFQWSIKSTKNNSQSVELDMIGEAYEDQTLGLKRSGSLRIILNGFSTLDHSDIIPHMLHSENSTQIDFIIDQLQSNRSFAQSRYGLELQIVSQGNPADPMMTADTKRSLDDEHTPGIFEVVEVKSTGKMSDPRVQSGYLQWRPVSYTNSSRDITSATQTMYYALMNCSSVFKASMLYAFYGDKYNDLMIERMNITIGSSGDGFYKKTNYSTWTAIIGYGSPPEEQFSYLVIMIISIGVGLPVVMLSIAAIYSYIRRLPRNSGTRLR